MVAEETKFSSTLDFCRIYYGARRGMVRINRLNLVTAPCGKRMLIPGEGHVDVKVFRAIPGSFIEVRFQPTGLPGEFLEPIFFTITDDNIGRFGFFMGDGNGGG